MTTNPSSLFSSFGDSNTCIVIAGPTASGKTAFAIKLAQHFNTQIISADSRQCYKELNIGVAKPSAEELAAVHHHFISSHSVYDDINAAYFEQFALEKCENIFAHNNVAIVVGGTGLYINALCNGIDDVPVIDTEMREKIIADYAANGLSWLQQQVQTHDAVYYAKGEIKNPQRLMRALEVKLSTGQSITTFQTRQKKQRPFKIIKLALDLPKDELHKNIHTRVDVMMQQGLLDEVKRVLSLKNMNALQTVGYRELFNYLDGDITLDAAVEQIKTNTRQYAKRQITWFKKDADFNWMNPHLPVSAVLAKI
jgi:tRNA dimethylallyltransferase